MKSLHRLLLSCHASPGAEDILCAVETLQFTACGSLGSDLRCQAVLADVARCDGMHRAHHMYASFRAKGEEGSG